ncbi:HNH endonuclease signature motif containing protein [Burkholderia sp. B21-005]|uniref:HNH endonuclease signature motif containing protein n=1 Tax=Burkholderia sp. B21-005 TaxID=2890406 RepID=UPI001E586EA0|nr:HNH endonuclease signature motif containing protein [Burkholderia sp. B21-005]UEP42759.1 hypothetical protein LMA02_07335 [Burkholderia sp. B21-005]
MDGEGITTKICTQCGQSKPATVEFFSAQKGGRFGLRGCCRPCFNKKYLKSRYDNDPEYRQKRLDRERKRYESKREEIKARVTQYRVENSASVKARRAQRYAENYRVISERKKAWYVLHGDEVRAARAKYREMFPERVRASKFAHYSENKADYIARNASRRAELIRATPRWADPSAIALLYREAERKTKKTGVDHHVDHIVPLRGRKVCGLHVENNLRVVTATENLSKHNKLIEDLLVA